MSKIALASTALVMLLASVGAASCNGAPKDSPASAASAPSGSAQAFATATSAAASASASETKPRLEGPGDVALGGTGVAITLPAGVSLEDGGTGSSWFIRGRQTSGLVKTSWSMPKTAQDYAKEHLCGPTQKKLTTKSLAGGGFMVRCEGPGGNATLTYKVKAVVPIIPPVKTGDRQADVAVECFHESTELSEIDRIAQICGSLHKQQP